MDQNCGQNEPLKKFGTADLELIEGGVYRPLTVNANDDVFGYLEEAQIPGLNAAIEAKFPASIIEAGEWIGEGVAELHKDERVIREDKIYGADGQLVSTRVFSRLEGNVPYRNGGQCVRPAAGWIVKIKFVPAQN